MRRSGDALGIEIENAVQVGNGGGEFGGVAGERGLEERLHAGGVTGKGGSKLRGIDRKGAVVVEVNAETGEAGDAVVAGYRGRERGEKAGLRFAC